MQAVPTALASDVSFNEGLLRLAAVHGKFVQFRYAKSETAPIETREFVPSAVYVTRDGNTVVAGEDNDRDAVRAYRLDRIKGEVKLA